MIEQRGRVGITEEELKEYCELKAENDSGSFALMSKVNTLAKRYENEIRSRSLSSTDALVERDFIESALRFLDALSSDEQAGKWEVIHNDKVIELLPFIEAWKLQRYESYPDITTIWESNDV